MKKYTNVRAIKAIHCNCYVVYKDDVYCIGVKHPIKNPECNGIKCKCTEYKYNRGDLK